VTRIVINENGMISGFHLATIQRSENHPRPAVFPKGRKCESCGCRLSVYNRNKRFCAPCLDPGVRMRLIRETT